MSSHQKEDSSAVALKVCSMNGFQNPQVYLGLSCPTHQETSGANRGQVACILERKTSSCYEFNYTKVRFCC